MKKTVLYLCVFIFFVACERPSDAPPKSPNSEKALTQPYVVLVSIDGFRYDYVEKYNLPNLKKIAEEGVAAEALLPVFPTKTFPNHYSIATGMYPANHGIVGNTFYDSDKDAIYRINDRTKVEDGSWYGGTPLWVLAEKQGMKAASYFWVGSEADVQGVRPSYYYPYDGSVPHAQRISQVVKWLELPEEVRPHFITLYFSDIDSKGHRYGPDGREVEEALKDIDADIRSLEQKLEGLDLPINLIITSDHGMTQINQQNPIRLDQIIDISKFTYAAGGTFYMLYANDQDAVDEAYEQLMAKSERYEVYKREDIPEYLNYNENKRIGDLIVIAKHPYVFTHTADLPSSPGVHGYDPQLIKDMHTIFYAKGPAFKKEMTIQPFENIHIYPLIAEILGLEYEGIDGRIDVLEPILVEE